MATITIFGVPPSSYVRTARMTCVEKGVDHELEVVEFGSAAHAKLHPFLKVPAMKHGDVHLYETNGICHYIDAAFEGPSLVPQSAVGRGRTQQWCSVLNCYAYADLVSGYVLPFLRGKLDDDALVDVLPKVERDLGLLNDALGSSKWLADDRLTIADLFWGPVVGTLAALPHSGKIVERSANVRRWLDRLGERESGIYLRPPQ